MRRWTALLSAALVLHLCCTAHAAEPVGFGIGNLDTKLPAPDWQDCEPVSDDLVCMDMDQIRLVLHVYAEYSRIRTGALLQAQMLALYESQNADLVRNTQDLMVQLHAAHLTMEKRQQLTTQVPDAIGHDTVTVVVYVLGAFVAGFFVSYYVHH